MSRIAIIDADIILHTAAVDSQRSVVWDGGIYVAWADLWEARVRAEEALEKIQENLQADRMILALSDYSDTPRFRKTILPSYKANRTDPKPVVYHQLREHFHEEQETLYEVQERPGLEGDDVIGIMMTLGVKRELVSVSRDKDVLRQVPGKHAHIDQVLGALHPSDVEITTVTPEDAHRFHMLQTLTGDRVDGYSGCPGMGPVKAEKLLEKHPPEEWWDAIVEAYKKADLTEEDAITQARVARILTADLWDFDRSRPILWAPTPVESATSNS